MHDLIAAVLTWLEQLGYWGIMIGLMLEVIPSEIVLSYGGYLVSKGHISFAGAVIFGTVGGVIAQLFVYWIGRYGGRPFLEKYGKYILINKHHIDVAEKWFDRYGAGVIFTARFIPVVRHAISIPAGITRMPLGRFTLLTTLAVIPWSIFFVYLGMVLGDRWEQIDEAAGPYVKPAMYAAAALLVLYVGWKWRNGRRERARIAGREEAVSQAVFQGESETAQQLVLLGKQYVLLHGVKLRGGGREQRFEHLAIGLNGLFHLESMDWSGEITFEGERMLRDGTPSKDPTSSLYRHEFVLKELLRSEGVEAEVIGVLVFTHPEVKVHGKSPAFATVRADRLLHFMSTHKAKKPLDSAKVQQIAAVIRKHTAAE